MGQHSGWQPQPFDWRSVALFYAFVVLLLGASICPRRARRFCSRPSPVCCCTRRGSAGKRQWLPYWLHVSLGETVLACGLFTVMGLAFTIAWFNMVDSEDDAPYLTSNTRIKVALASRCIGHVNEAQIGLALLPVTRNSVWLHGLGVPYEQALKYHRFLGRMTIVLMTVHMGLWWGVWASESTLLANAFQQAGYVAGALADPTVPFVEAAWVLAVCLASLQLVRRTNFEAFLFPHYAMLVVVGLVAFHSWFAGGYLCYLLVGPVLLYVVDRVARCCRSRQAVAVLAIEPVDGGTVVRYEVQHLGADSVHPGQYAFLCIPELTLLEWHPVSYSSVSYGPSQTRLPERSVGVGAAKRITLTHHIKDMGPGTWTGNLRRLAVSASVSGHSGRRLLGVRVCSDGPYGLAFNGVDVGATDTLVLVGGGVGVTPIMAALQELLHNEAIFASTTALRRVEFLWVVRDPAQVAWFEGVLHQAREAQRANASAAATGRLEFTVTVHATCRFVGAHACPAADLSVHSSGSSSLMSLNGSPRRRDDDVALRPASSVPSPAQAVGGLPLSHSSRRSQMQGAMVDSSAVALQRRVLGAQELAASRGCAIGRPDMHTFLQGVRSRRLESGAHRSRHAPHRTSHVSVWVSGPTKLMEAAEVSARAVFGNSECHVVRSNFVL